MTERIAYTAERIFTGDGWLTDQAVVVANGVIDVVTPIDQLPEGIVRRKFPDASISPAFVDLQIYGAHGRLLAIYPEADSLSKLNDYCRDGGAAYCMPTVATNHYDVFYRSIDAIRAYWANGGAGVLGLHIEGPWINPKKRGAHIESLIHSPSMKQVEDLLAYGKDVIRIITLAPEMCSTEVIERILQAGIVVSAGHSNADYEQATGSFSRGIKAVTHLYNAMSPLAHRAPGLAGAAMDDDRVMASIIPDGHHVDYAALRIAKAAAGERLFAITDAVTETNEGPYQHHLMGDKYEAGGIMSGSALTMDRCVQNLIHHVRLTPGEAIRMCSLYPARVIGMDDRFGMIAAGYSANMVVLDHQYKAISLITPDQ